MERLAREVQPKFKPRINSKSREMDISRKEGSTPRTDLMYSYAQKYDQHKKELKDQYQNENNEDLDFNPKLNKKSMQIAENSQKNFIDRTMEKFYNKSRRQDRDADEIEF